MITYLKTGFFYAVFFAMVITFAFPEAEEDASNLTRITSDGKLIIDYKKKTADFNENVLVREPKGTLRSDKLIVYFDPDGETLNKMVATGHVKIDQEEQKAEAGRAEYHSKEGRLILTGHPVIEKGPNRYSAEKITIITATNQVLFEPSAKIVIKKDQKTDSGILSDDSDRLKKNQVGKKK
ncbi:MAG: hypothetical protein JW774_11705 [Candidatus Aureabacteria bacterium]|nr:hypothetical protein [Candidatus Auribacterota bacterium]